MGGNMEIWTQSGACWEELSGRGAALWIKNYVSSFTVKSQLKFRNKVSRQGKYENCG